MPVYSPTSMSLYRDCPRRYEGQYVTKEIEWKSSKSRDRGIAVHGFLEQAIQGQLKAEARWPDVDRDYAQRVINNVRQLSAHGYTLNVEHEMTLDRNLAKAARGWWDESAWLRAKADVLCLPPTSEGIALIGDIKTGKKWDSDNFQLRIECLLVKQIYGVSRSQFSYWYVDSGETTSGLIDLSENLTAVQDILDQLKEMDRAWASKYFPPKPNKFCRWCQFHGTEDCGL